MPKKPEEVRRIIALNMAHIQPLQSAITPWSVTPMIGISAEDLLEPEYWKHVADVLLKPDDLIWARSQDGSWWAAYMVLYTGPNFAKLHMLSSGTLEQVMDADTETHEVLWISPSVRYGVKRKSDKETIKDGFETKAEAADWLNQNIRQLAA